MRISDWSSDVCSSDLKRDRCGRRTSAASERALDLDALEALDLVDRLHVVVLLYADTALGAAADLVAVLLEAEQGFQLALEDHGVVAQNEDRRSDEHTSELQTLKRHSYAVSCLTHKCSITK